MAPPGTHPPYLSRVLVRVALLLDAISACPKEAPMQGRRLPDTILGEFPVPGGIPEPGSYWKVMSRKDPAVPMTPDVLKHGTSPENGNLTNTVWGIVTPNGLYGMLSIHTVREHEDGTISIRPGDGSSNSVLIEQGPGGPSWHGYVEHGIWTAC